MLLEENQLLISLKHNGTHIFNILLLNWEEAYKIKILNDEFGLISEITFNISKQSV